MVKAGVVAVPINKKLMFECAFECIGCQGIIEVRTFLAVAQGDGQEVTCRTCKERYTVVEGIGAIAHSLLPKWAQGEY